MKKLLLITPLLLSLSAFSFADYTSGLYAGGGLAYWNLSDNSPTDPEDVKDPNINYTAEEFVIGYKKNPYVGFEGRLGYASQDPSFAYVSAYYRLESQNETAKSYLLFGYSYADFIGVNDSGTGISGFSYGAGVGFPVGKQMFFNLEYRMLMDDSSDNLTIQGLSAGLDYRF